MDAELGNEIKLKVTKNELDNSISDYDRLIHHIQFKEILNLVSELKLATLNLNVGCRMPSKTTKSSIDAIYNIMRIKTSKLDKIVHRGMFPSTDSLVDETIAILQHEIKRCKSLKQCASKKKPIQEPIAVKYSKYQTDILTQWMIDNRSHPFPSPTQIEKLSKETGLSYSQIVNWTTNVRKRNLKATVEGGKKPHHFLDFLFLAENRDKHDTTSPNKKIKSSIGKKTSSRKKPCVRKSKNQRASQNICNKPNFRQKEIPVMPTQTIEQTPFLVTPTPSHFGSSVLPPKLRIFELSSEFETMPIPLSYSRNTDKSHHVTDGGIGDVQMKDLTLHNEEVLVGKSGLSEVEMSLMNEDILTPRKEDALSVVQTLMDYDPELPIESVKLGLVGKRLSIPMDSFEKVLPSLQDFCPTDIDDLLNSPMEDLGDDCDLVVDV